MRCPVEAREAKRSSRVQAVVASAGLVALAGCGPRVDEPQDWMLGVFSNIEPPQIGGGDAPLTVTQYHVRDDFTMDLYWTDRNDGVNTSGAQGPVERTWEPRGADAIAFPHHVYPNVEYIVKRTGECGPHEVEERTTTAEDPPRVLTSSAGHWYRGAACVRLGEPITIENCHGYCRNWSIGWCDGPPPQCGDEDEDG